MAHQYKYPNAKWRYTRIADYLQLGGNTEDEKIELLIKSIDELKAKINLELLGEMNAF